MGFIRKLLLAATTVAGFSFAGSAEAATVTYTSTNVPQSIAEGGNKVSTLTVPAGRTDTTDIDVVGIQLLAASNSGDQRLFLFNPAGANRAIVFNPGCPSYPAGTNFSLDQQAPGNPFGGAGTCPPGTGTYRPSTSPATATPLQDLVGSYASGIWMLTYNDTAASGSGGTLNGWGLRITHEPLTCTLTPLQPKVELKQKLEISTHCNAYYSVTTSRDAKPKTFTVSSSGAKTQLVSLTKKARKRLRKKGKAKIGLTVDDGYGDIINQTVKVKISRKKGPDGK